MVFPLCTPVSPIALAEAVLHSFCTLGALSLCLSRTPGRTGAPWYNPVGNDYIPIGGTTVLGLLTWVPAVHSARRSQAEVLFSGLSDGAKARQRKDAQMPPAVYRCPGAWLGVMHPFA